eukprot:CAMPEP_0119122774 /NCGR_PEP_ID=MMETSP1310-20130426/2934_1 /TAXON_ID=464262 /ORGANISM="Genus nov. species nov., Strain RCC2339" /LENGTH=125 /DNA_ID=CAMNT_0007112485 /DNA_START=136 /DNA_END=509 /DNA_ORIENTATION=+
MKKTEAEQRAGVEMEEKKTELGGTDQAELNRARILYDAALSSLSSALAVQSRYEEEMVRSERAYAASLLHYQKASRNVAARVRWFLTDEEVVRATGLLSLASLRAGGRVLPHPGANIQLDFPNPL